MPDDTVEEIKSRLDIVDLVKEYVELEKVGSNLRALCPFHAEKTPSFFVSPSRQSWRCFGGCNIGGDIFDFVMKIEGVEFYEALQILAKKAGVEVKKRDPKKREEKDRLYEICELATKFFQTQLEKSKKGKAAKKYLVDRGIKEEAVKKWRLGYGPDSWQALSEFLISKGYKRKEIVKTGLAVKKDDHSYDRFRGRIIFPIMNTASDPIAFGGRIFGEKEDTAKYINSPQTPLYDKSGVLYGLDKAKIEIRRQDEAILVEGYTDVIMSHQAGVKNVISTSGTALTEKQLKILSRYTRNLLIAFDMDSAGASATKKGIEMARKTNFNVKIILLPEEKDPADLILKDKKEWKDAIQQAEEVMKFYFNDSFSGRDPEDPMDKKKIAGELLPLIKRIPNRIERAHWIKELAEKMDVDEEVIAEEIKEIKMEKDDKKKKRGEKTAKRNDNKKRKTRKTILEERIISLIAKNPEKKDLTGNKSIFSKRTIELIEAINNNVEDEKIKKRLDYFALKPERGIGDPEKEIERCLKEIKREKIKNDLLETHKRIKKAENKGDKKELSKLTEKAYKLSKKLQEHNHG